MMHLQILQQTSKIPESLLRQTKILEYFETLDTIGCVDFFLELHSRLKNPDYDFMPLHLDLFIHDQWRKFLGPQVTRTTNESEAIPGEVSTTQVESSVSPS